MPRVVPSQVVAMIDRAFPRAKDQMEDEPRVELSAGHSTELAGVIELAESVPDELLRLSAEEFAIYRVAIAACRSQIEGWRIRDSTFRFVGGSVRTTNTYGFLPPPSIQVGDDSSSARRIYTDRQEVLWECSELAVKRVDALTSR